MVNIQVLGASMIRGKRAGLILTLAALVGCGSQGPATTHSTSSASETLAQKVDFLQRYISYRRTYETLEYQVDFRNGDGFAPSEWDVRLVAKVPASEVQAWVPPGVARASKVDREWLGSIPRVPDLAGISEWYVEQGRIIGIDRERSLIAYRTFKH